MRDPHVHAEKMPIPGFGHAAMRDLIATTIGVAPDLPKTVTTGCGKRRPIAATSTVPERVTCLACREYAAGQYLEHALLAEALLADAEAELWAAAKVTPDQLAEQAREYRVTAARYTRPPAGH
jgi:recombinational DNA repair protein (RecF pathway)